MKACLSGSAGAWFLAVLVVLQGCSHGTLLSQVDEPLAGAPPTAEAYTLDQDGERGRPAPQAVAPLKEESPSMRQSAPQRGAEEVESKAERALVPQVGEPLSGQANPDGWEEFGYEDGIRLWKKDVEGSSVVAFRGEAVIDATIPKIASVLSDANRRGEWISDAKESKDLRQFSLIDRVEYNRTGTPWPLQDRDFVYRTRVSIDREARKMMVDIRSVEDALMPPRPGIVRGQLMHSSYALAELGDGRRTRVRVEIHADPRGDIPKWVVNLFQKGWPKATLDGLRRQVAKSDVFEDPQVKAYLDEGIEPDWAKATAQVAEINKSERKKN